MNIALVGNDGRANALKWHFERYGHTVSMVTGIPNSSLSQVIYEWKPFDLIILTKIEDSANGLQNDLVNMFGSGKVFACNMDASRFETDKAYGIKVAREYGLSVPKTIDTDNIQLIKDKIPGDRYVIKKQGLACGQGVKIVHGTDELRMIMSMWSQISNDSILVQEYKEGIEISGRVLCQQGNIIPLWMTMEHKMAYNDSRGPCTAEMGTVILAGVGKPILNEIKKLEPWLREVNYTGMIDINFIMDTKGRLWFIEPTCRWGDPETEIALPMLRCDFAEIILKACRGEVLESDITFINKTAIGVVIAGGGYPYKDVCLQGMPIEFPQDAYPYVFQMGTEKISGEIVTKGGRHLVVVGTGQSVYQARSDVYRMVRSNRWFLDAWYRTDIGDKWEKQLPFLLKKGVIEL